MKPLFSPCGACSHPAIKVARQCKAAMALANAARPSEAEELLESLNMLPPERKDVSPPNAASDTSDASQLQDLEPGESSP